MERRKFLGWIGVGMLATNFPVLLAACSSSSSTSTNDSPNNATPKTSNSSTASTNQAETSFTVGTEQELADKGFLFNREKKVIVIADESGKAIAFDSTCNHQGCLVEWNATKTQFICPCHDSIFEADGKLVTGPATESLPPLISKVENGSIIVEPLSLVGE